MNRVDRLLATPDVTLWRFDHPPGEEHADPEHEVSPFASINLVEAGSFDIRIEDRRYHFAPGSLFVTAGGLEFSCSHSEGVPTDRCLTVAFDEQAVDDLLSIDVPRLVTPAAEPAPREAFLLDRLRHVAAGDELRCELLAGALYQSLAERDPSAMATTSATSAISGATSAAGSLDVPAALRSELSRRIERALERMAHGFSEPLSLRELARVAGLSTFRFARVFRELVGVPPHRYLTAVRLRQAARRLTEGASVTATAFDVGFGSLSHFVVAFRERYGFVPSEVARGRNVRALRSALRKPRRPRKPTNGKKSQVLRPSS
jgi:AraC-like DNA-binding protein